MVELFAVVDLLVLETAVGLTAGVVVPVVLLTTGSLRLDLPRLPLLRLRLLVVLQVVEREGELVREGRGDSVSGKGGGGREEDGERERERERERVICYMEDN